MKTLLQSLAIALACLLFTKNSFSQIPPNLMAMDARMVDSVMKTIGGSFTLKDYTDAGKPIVTYEIDYSFKAKRNSQGNTLGAAFFVFGIENKCTNATYIYMDKSNLSSIVDALDTDERYSKKKDSFGWESKRFNYDVNINRDENTFSLTYIWLSGIRGR